MNDEDEFVQMIEMTRKEYLIPLVETGTQLASAEKFAEAVAINSIGIEAIEKLQAELSGGDAFLRQELLKVYGDLMATFYSRRAYARFRLSVLSSDATLAAAALSDSHFALNLPEHCYPNREYLTVVKQMHKNIEEWNQVVGR